MAEGYMVRAKARIRTGAEANVEHLFFFWD